MKANFRKARLDQLWNVGKHCPGPDNNAASGKWNVCGGIRKRLRPEVISFARLKLVLFLTVFSFDFWFTLAGYNSAMKIVHYNE